MADIGYATLPIIPSMRGARAAIEGEIGGIGGNAGARAGDEYARSFSSRAKSGLASGLATLTKGAGVVAAAALAAGGALAAMGVKGAASLETTTTSFTALLGSSKAATEQIATLQKYAAQTPFSQQDVLGYAQQYYSLAGSVGLSKDNVTQFLDAVGNLGAVTGASTENIHNAVMAIGQIGSSGKVTLDNLNQISEAFPGFNGAAAIASATGQTTAQVMKEISAGTMDAKTGVTALLRGMQDFNGASGAMAKQAQTLTGLWSTFTDTIQIKLTQAFQPIIPVIKKTLDTITPVIASTLGTLAPQIASLMQGLAPLIAPLVQGLGRALGAVFSALGPMLAALQPVITPLANAFVALVQAIAPLAVLAGKIIGQIGPPLLQIFTSIAQAVAPLVQALANALAPVLPVIAQAINNVMTALQPFMNALAGAFLQAIEAIAPQLPQIAEAFGTMAVALANLLSALAPVIGPLITLVTKVFTGPVVSMIIGVAQAITLLADALTSMVNVVSDGASSLGRMFGIIDSGSSAMSVDVQNNFKAMGDSAHFSANMDASQVYDATNATTNLINGGFASMNDAAHITATMDISDAEVKTAQLADLLGQLQTGKISQSQYDSAASNARASAAPTVKYSVPAFHPAPVPSSGGSSGGGGGGISGPKPQPYHFKGRGFSTRSEWQKAIRDDVGGVTAKINVDVNTDGIKRVRAELAASTKRLGQDIAAGLDSKAAKAIRKRIATLRTEATAQLRQLIGHIRAVDVPQLGTAASKSIGDARTAYTKLVHDMRHAGASNAMLAQFKKLQGSAADTLANSKGKRFGPTIRGNKYAGHLSMLGLAAARERTVKALDAANQRLVAAQTKWSNEQSTVKSAFMGAFNVSSAGKADASGRVSVGSILAQLKQTVAKSKRFYDLLRSLKAKGVPVALLDQLAQAGPDALPQAEALGASSSTDLSQIKAQYKSLDSVSTGIGSFMADGMYLAGVNSAQGLVNGLKSQKSQIDAAIGSLADSMLATLRRHLHIHSPSRKTRQLGRYTGQGHWMGVLDEVPNAERAAKSIANASTPKLSPRASGGSGGSTGNDAQVVEAVVDAVMGRIPERFAFEFNGREVARMNEKSAQVYARGR